MVDVMQQVAEKKIVLVVKKIGIYKYYYRCCTVCGGNML